MCMCVYDVCLRTLIRSRWEGSVIGKVVKLLRPSWI